MYTPRVADRLSDERYYEKKEQAKGERCAKSKESKAIYVVF